MKKILRFSIIGALVFSLIWTFGLVADRMYLNANLFRLHVVANSDSPEDQAIKLQVRDAIMESLQDMMHSFSDVESAKAYLKTQLENLQIIANEVLEAAGVEDRAKITLTKEAFSTRDYDTFSLPAGVYESLRVTIGEGEGHNWWCVVFPSLCLPAAGEGFADTAVGAGFSEPLTQTLQKEEGYEIRFFFLDCLGWLQNIFSGV